MPVDALQVSRVQGSLSAQSAGELQAAPATQPETGLQLVSAPQSAEVGAWRQLPEALQLSTVQATSSSQSAAASQPTWAHVTPFPAKPRWHEQVYAPGVFTHIAVAAQLSLPRAHSSTRMREVQTRPSPR